MSPRRTRRGTIRESVAELSADTSLKSTQKVLRSTRKGNKSLAAKSEEDSDVPAEVNSLIDSSITASIMNETTENGKKRKKRGKEVSVNQDATMLVNIDEPSNKSQAKKVTAKTPRSRKQTKSSKSESENLNSLISEDESFNTKFQKRQVAYNVVDLISEDEELQSSSSKKIKLNNEITIATKKASKTPKRKTLNKPSIKLTPDQKSSPLNVSLTPDRSRKTPRKSPINLGSPKTHTHDPLRFLSVPRKLSITDSPPTSEASGNSPSPRTSNEAFKNISKSQKNSKSNKKSTPSPLKTALRFSKSPKIMLKTPKRSERKTSKKSLSINVTPKEDSLSKIKKSPKNTSSKSKKSPEVEAAVSENISPIKSEKSDKTDLLSKSINTSKSSASESQKSNNSSKKRKKSPKETSFGKLKKSSKFIIPTISKKMPKIVLTLKSKKSIAKLSRSMSPLKTKKSMPKSSKSLSPSKLKKSLPKTSEATSTSKLKNASPSKITKKSPNRSSIKSTDKDLLKNLSMSPRVLVNKLSTSQLKHPSLMQTKNQPSVNLIPVDHARLHIKLSPKKFLTSSKKSPKFPKSSVNRSSTVKLVTPVRPTFNSKTNTPIDVLEKTLLNLKPTNTSTPRDRIKHALTVTSSIKKGSIQKSANISIGLRKSPLKSKVIKRLTNQSKVLGNLRLLEDESEPSMNDTSLIHMSQVFDDTDITGKDNTFEITKSDSKKEKSVIGSNTSQKSNKSNSTFEKTKNTSSTSTKGKKKNNTYEVEDSKTPAFKTNSKKRTSKEAELDANQEPETKKVHFASPDLRNQTPFSGIKRIGTPGHARQQKTPVSTVKTKTPVKLAAKVNSVSKPQNRPSVSTPATKRKSLAGVSLSGKKSDHQTQIASVNRLSRPKPLTDTKKKIETKTPVPKKIPNFAEIHQKHFAKMESLIDFKKRIELRHVTSSAKKTPSGKPQNATSKPTSTESTGAYNRFGFKLRKNDAVNIISKKQTGSVDTREKNRENARSTLKGVRTNRRFELQMQARNKNS